MRHVSPWLDLSISFGTLLYLAGLPTGLMPRLRLVPKRQTVEQTYQDAAGSDAALPMVQPV